MPRRSDPSTRRRARQVFDDHLAQAGDYRAAARAAGVSDRTGRRWRSETLARLSSSDPSPDPTNFVGREGDLDAISDLFSDGGRLITVVGPPGMGKTRLVRRWIRNGERADAATYFCDLRQANTTEDLCSEVARSLHVRLADGGSPRKLVETLARVLRARGLCFVVLDNFEQLLPSAAEAVAAWLRDAPEIHFLVTSRRMLRLSTERLYELAPLTIPRADDDWNCDAMRLFVERARRVEPSFSSKNVSAADTATLVRLLEGIPLALELAAAQMGRTSPGELLSQLRHPVTDLRNIYRDGDPRHATLWDALNGSWRLLSPVERIVLPQLTVFRSGFSLESALAVVRAKAGVDGRPLAEVIASLREASLVRVAELEDPELPRRWDAFEAIREFGQMPLESSQEVNQVRARHAQHFLELGERLSARCRTPDGERAKASLLQELDNFRAAFTWFLQPGREHLGREIANRVCRMALVIDAATRKTLPAVAVGALSQALAFLSDHHENVGSHQAELHLARGSARRETGDHSEAEVDLGRAHELADGDSEIQAEIRYELGALSYARGETRTARRQLDDALAMARAHDAKHLEGRVQRAMAWVLAEAFYDPKAFEHHRAADTLLRRCGDRPEQSMARRLWAAHRSFFQQGDPTEELQRQLQRAASLKNRPEEASGWICLAMHHQDRGRLAQARECFERARSVAALSGLGRWEAVAINGVGYALDESGDSDRALQKYEQALEMFTQLREARLACLARIFLAGLLARSDNPERALALSR